MDLLNRLVFGAMPTYVIIQKQIFAGIVNIILPLICTIVSGQKIQGLSFDS